MVTSSMIFPPIRNLPPINNGGSIARSGFCFQDHVAISFCLELLTDPELFEVWCETQDDITLLWHRSGSEEVEFVQVKGLELDSLWTLAELCKREKTRANPSGIGTSILERSLAHDRCEEVNRYRLVTAWQVNKELKILSLPLSSPERTSPNKTFDKLMRETKTKVDGYLSPKGNDSSFWLRNLYWQVEYSEDAVMRRNLEHLMNFVESLGWGISLENARKHIYPTLLTMVQDAARTDWSTNSEKKKIKKADFKCWLENTVNASRYLALGGSGKKLREKMINKASLPETYFESAVEERRRYKQEVLQPNYLVHLGVNI